MNIVSRNILVYDTSTINIKMIESIGLNLVASGLASGGGIGADKARCLLRQKRFSEEVDGLTTEFTSALKHSVEPAIKEQTGVPDTDGTVEWAAVAVALNEQPIGFEDEEEAIVQLTDAIDTGIDANLDTDPEYRAAVEAAVAEAYHTTIRKFAERVAGTELAEVFLMETSLGLSTAVEQVSERLIAIQRELRRETAALRNVGFVRLDSLYFERHEPGDPEAAWRTGFSLAEVQAGYPLPRERPATTPDERSVVAEDVFDRLTAGENLVVKGEGGTGKSTVCKRVACQWHADADLGAVLYRGSATTTSFDEPGTLIDAIRADSEHLLVVVEDAPSGSANAIFEVLTEFGRAFDVTFLLDARNGAWEAATEVGGHATLERQRQHLGIVEMPALDERECQRAIDQYTKITGETPTQSGEQVYEQIRSADIGGPLVLAYRLTGPATDTERPVSALHADVRRAYTAVEEWTDGDDFPQTVATMINVLNAAGLPVVAAFVHTLADEHSQHRVIEHTLGFLEGTVLEQTSDGLQMPHQQWSALYLHRMFDVVGERLAAARFERCVEALFRLLDEDSARDTVRRWVRTPPEAFTAITETPEETAGRFVRQIADIGTIRPSLGALYGTPETWNVQLPEPCPITAHLQWFITRGRTHIDRGALDAAQAEFEQANKLINSREDEHVKLTRQRARVRANLGIIARKRGNLEWAHEQHLQSHALAQDSDDRQIEARSLRRLGAVAQDRGKLSAAREYYEKGEALCREIDNHHGKAVNLHNLGDIARMQGNLDAAQEYHEKSLAFFREVGDRHGEAATLHGLGDVVQEHGELSAAQEYYEEGLARFREMGYSHGEAVSLYNLGDVEKMRGNLDAAQEYHEEGLALFREVGDRHRKAKALHRLGDIAKARGGGRSAEKYYKESLDLLRKNDIVGEALDVFVKLIDICRQRGDELRAIEWCEQAIDFAEETEQTTKRSEFQERRSALLDTEER